MALENMKVMLRAAMDGRYAVGAFNILDYNSMLAVVRAAEEVDAPVIVQTSAKTVTFWGTAAIVSWGHDIADNSPVPVALHLDHCKDLQLIEECINTGWTSVMIDASAKPFEENLALSKKVVAMAEKKDVTVEAELGQIVGVEDDIAVDQDDAYLADPDKSERFCKEVPLACFAPAIGTAHGIYKGEPKIAFDRIESIAKRTRVPLALHGGTGLSEEVVRRCISLGCAKVNISTQLKYAFIDEFVSYHSSHNKEYNPLSVISAQFERIKNVVAQNITLFGSAGRATGKEGLNE
jgi:ketose-bisphosphate aldolase